MPAANVLLSDRLQFGIHNFYNKMDYAII